MIRLYVSATKLDKLPHPTPPSDTEGILRCATCPQLYSLRLPFPVRAEDVELHIQTLQHWIDNECAERHPAPSFCTDGVTPCL